LWILPQSSQAVDIEGTFTSDSAFPVHITDPSFYTLNGEAYSGEIDSDTNLTVNGILSSNPSQNTITVAASSATAGNFTYNLELPANFWAKNVFEVYTPITFSVENFTLNLRESDTPHPNLIIYTGTNSTLNVRGDFLFSDTRSSTNWYQTRLSFSGNGNVAIDGNFTINSQISKPSSHALNCVNFEVATTQTFTVGGVLSLSNSNGNNNVFRTTATSAGTFTRSLGGLQITQRGMIQLAGNASAVNTTELIFTNSGTSEYIGGLLTRDSDGELANNKLNVRMTASDAANGRQIIRFNTTSGWTLDNNVYSDAANALNEVEVSGGRLDLGMYGGMKGGSLMIMGYNNPSEAVFSATGAGVSGSEIGRVEFDSMSFYRGTVVFDLAETDGDFIKVNGAMTKITGASPLVLEMNVSAYDLQAWLEASESDEWSANLMSFATDGSNVSAEDFTLKLQDGIMGKITVSELDGVSTLTANLSLVPEPAEVAAILGAFALLLVARRRRG
jgi:hypothetical protein